MPHTAVSSACVELARLAKDRGEDIVVSKMTHEDCVTALALMKLSGGKKRRKSTRWF